jgi:phosphatidate cytidylyltransferase
MTSNLNKNQQEIPKSDSLRNRIIYGFSGFFLVLGGMIWNQWSYGFVFLVICMVCQYEFFNLVFDKKQKLLRNYGLVMGFVFYVGSFMISASILPDIFYFWAYPIFAGTFILVLYQKEHPNPFQQLGFLLLGLVYVVMPFSALHWSVFSAGYYRYEVILGIFFLIWIHDIEAYFIGSRYGKRLLFPRISPKKSWEGSIGGGLMAILMAVLLHFYLLDLSLIQWIVLALIITIAGTHGDLVESMLKRSLQIKDSSQALPGHGGFLDRFDNLLMSAPFIALFLKIF